MASKNGQSNPRTSGPAGRSYIGAVGSGNSRSQNAANAWQEVDTTDLAAAVIGVTAAGGGLLVGATRDGSCIGVTVFYADERVRFYPRDSTECGDLLRFLAAWSLVDEPTIAQLQLGML